jgi:hypothetical protein
MNYNNEEYWKRVYRNHIKNCIKWAVIVAFAMFLTYFFITGILAIGLLLVK